MRVNQINKLNTLFLQDDSQACASFQPLEAKNSMEKLRQHATTVKTSAKKATVIRVPFYCYKLAYNF